MFAQHGRLTETRGNFSMAMIAGSFAIQDKSKLFEPDAILPDQFYANFKANQHREPERRLMVAILEDAVSCLSLNPQRCNLKQRKQYEEAAEWVFAEDETEWIFSFRGICDALGLDPGYLRRGLTRPTVANRAVSPAKHRPARFGLPEQRKKLRLRTGS
jgi:hypothetical protein